MLMSHPIIQGYSYIEIHVVNTVCVKGKVTEQMGGIPTFMAEALERRPILM